MEQCTVYRWDNNLANYILTSEERNPCVVLVDFGEASSLRDETSFDLDPESVNTQRNQVFRVIRILLGRLEAHGYIDDLKVEKGSDKRWFEFLSNMFGDCIRPSS